MVDFINVETFVGMKILSTFSVWGHTFRPAYLEVCSIRKTFPEIPVVVLTATATAAVLEDYDQDNGAHFSMVTRYREKDMKDNEAKLKKRMLSSQCRI